MAGLTEKQKRFADEYLIDLNATAAYRRAGYTARGNAAEVNASRLLSNAKVQAHIQKRMQDRSKRTEITQDKVLHELAKIGFSNMSDYSLWGPQGVMLRDSSQLTLDQAAAVAEVSQTITDSGGSIKFKLHDKVAALEKIGKHLGMFRDKVELTGDEGGPLQVVFSDKMRPPDPSP